MSNENHKNHALPVARITSMFFRGLKRLWWIALLLILIFSAVFGYRSWSSYSPQYTASETFTVYTSNDAQAVVTQYNVAAAEQIAKTFPNILQSGILSELVKADIGCAYLPAIRAEAVKDVNLIKLSVTSWDPEFSYAVLQSVVKNYPSVSEYVVGPTELVIINFGEK